MKRKTLDSIRPLSDDEYYSIMERVAIDNNPIWNQYRSANGYRPLSEDEEMVRVINDNSYDYRGYYNKHRNSQANANTHWDDEFKTYLHPTFSTFSKYSGKKSKFNPKGLRGGIWLSDNTFIPAGWQLVDRILDK